MFLETRNIIFQIFGRDKNKINNIIMLLIGRLKKSYFIRSSNCEITIVYNYQRLVLMNLYLHPGAVFSPPNCIYLLPNRTVTIICLDRFPIFGYLHSFIFISIIH